MNLKEAFRFQNKLQNLMEETEYLLGDEKNITRVEKTVLRKKVMPEAENETTVEVAGTEYADRITAVADFLLYLLGEREKLSCAIFEAKAKVNLPAGLDGEVSLNGTRQRVSQLLRRMTALRNSEVLLPGGGLGYRFNNEGNQVSYRCDVRKVTTINFDRNRIRSHCAALCRKADSVSAAMDAAMVNTQVEYVPPFDVNETFAEVFEAYCAA